MYDSTDVPEDAPSVTSFPRSESLPKVEDFVSGENPTERGWNTLEDSFTAKSLAPVVKALRDSGNKPVAVSLFPWLNGSHVGGFNGASVRNGCYFKLVLVHKDKSFADNELKLLPLSYLSPNPPGNMRCSDQ